MTVEFIIDNNTSIETLSTFVKSYKRIVPIKTYRNRLLMWETLWQWSKKNLGARRQKILLKRFVGFASTPYYESSRSNLMFYLQGNKQLYLLLKQYPLLSREPLYWREFIRMFRLLFANFALL